MLGRDGVLRRFNSAYDTVGDYAQFSADHIAEYIKAFPQEAQEMWAGVDGRAVTNDAQLWAVPDDVVPRQSSVMVTKPKRDDSLFETTAQNCRLWPCEDDEQCRAEYNCAACNEYYECVGGPTGCSRLTRCDDILP